MQAAVLHGVQDLRVEDIPRPEPRDGQVLVRVAHNGICGSDLHKFYHGYYDLDFSGGDARPQILGHEFSGLVAGTGDHVDDLTIGTRVAVLPAWGCEKCPTCRAGVPHLCPGRTSLNRVRLEIAERDDPDGPRYTTFYGAGLSEYVVVPERCIVPLADNVSLSQGALIEPMAVAYTGIMRSGARPGTSVLIVGGGPVGIGVFLGLRSMGIEQIIVSEPSAKRRAAIEALGAAVVLDPSVIDVPRAVKDMTGGLGAGAVIEAAGTPRSFASALDSCAPLGRLTLIAIFEEPPKIDPYELIRREIDLVGAIGYDRPTFDRVHDLMSAGHYATEGWVEHVRFEDLVPAIEDVRSGGRIKVLIDLPA